jgi:hypothetical protein
VIQVQNEIIANNYSLCLSGSFYNSIIHYVICIFFYRACGSHFRAGNLVDQSMATDLTGEVTSSAGPVQLEDLQRILRSIQAPGDSADILCQYVFYRLYHYLFFIGFN